MITALGQLLNDPNNYGAIPLPDGSYRMVPSGDIVDIEELHRRQGVNCS